MDADGSSRTVIGSGFALPYGVAADTSGHVFVADTYNGRIVKMNADGSNQTVIASASNLGPGGDVDPSIGIGFGSPHGVAVDSSGHVYVPDGDRIVKMNADGSNQTAIGSGLSASDGVAVDTSGHIFVADTGNNRIVVLNASFNIPDQTIPNVQAGQALVATQLESAAVDPSTSPRVTSVKWFASSMPAGLKLSSSGVLSGTANVALAAGTYSIYVVAIEKVTTKIGRVTTATTKTTSRVLPIVIT
jgi:sugar lactone lactonase YvrE